MKINKHKQISLLVLLWFSLALSMPDLFHDHEHGEIQSESCPVYILSVTLQVTGTIDLNTVAQFQEFVDFIFYENSEIYIEPTNRATDSRAPPLFI